MKKDNLTPPMIVAWFRQQAKKFNEMADFVVGTFAAGMPAVGNGALSVANLEFNTENVRNTVLKRGHRIDDLAARFHVPRSRVEDIINNPDSGLYIGLRGWVKAKEKNL
jgi:hypothetical protein